MRDIVIKSKLYDYNVSFVDDFRGSVEKLGTNVTYVIDKKVFELYMNGFSGIDVSKTYLVEAIESKKNMETVLDIINFWQRIGVKKNWKVICIGGGITQDITTIASNLFLRNIQWYFFPTTLLAMSDSCIGGKSGINLGNYKNQLGVFYPPKNIFIDIRFIETLSEQDYLNGWGEILKFSLTSDVDFYKSIRNLDSYIPCTNIDKYLYMGLNVKKKIIEVDEFDSGVRKTLNYGHTFGHALEAYTNNLIPHGEAVIWGIDVANYIAVKEKLLSEELYLDIKCFIKKSFILQEIEIEDPDKLFRILSTDKKVSDNKISLVMLNGLCNLKIYPMALDGNLKRLFVNYIKETHDYYSK